MNTFIVDCLATYRGTKLIIDDQITQGLRDKAFEELAKLPGPLARRVEYLLTCPWCVGIWVAILIATLRHITPNLAEYLSTILATSAVTGLIYERI